MLFLVCESLKMGGVQSLYLRLALESSKPITIISLTESHDDAFIKSLHENDIPYFYYSDFSQWSIGTKRATMANSIPLSSRKVLLQFNTPVSYFHVSSLSGAVFVHRLSKLIRNQSKVKLNVGIYHGLIFGWKSSFNTYYSRLSSEILKGFFGEFGVLFYNKVVQTSYEKKLGCALSGDIIPIGIRVKNEVKERKSISQEPKIISIGRLVPYKSYNLNLIELMPDLISQGFKFQFEIYGEGAYSTLLEEKVQSLGLGEYVKFKGLIEYSQISKSFDDADFFIGCGTTLLEASAEGVPSIIGIENMNQALTYGFLTDTSGYSYHEKDLEFPLLQLRDVIVKCLSLTPKEYEKLSISHRVRARLFSIESSIAVLNSNYEKIEFYNPSEVNLNLFRLQLSIMFEQLTTILGVNKLYYNKIKIEN